MTPTFHVATVHWRSDRWIDIQRRYLDQNLDAPFRVYASLEGVDPIHRAKFDHVIDDSGKHAEKLNHLAEAIVADAAPDDVVVFLDGDAFPIVPITDWARRALDSHPLVAVRRDENWGDPQPHPSFCATTTRFWREIQGDWRAGYTWLNRAGVEVTDVGGNLLGALSKTNTDWLPLLRTNTVDLHPVMFGVYGAVVYHHGAGFRAPQMRADWSLTERLSRGGRQHSDQPTLRRRALYRVARRATRRRISANRAIHDEVYAQIVADPEFFRQFLV